MKDEHKTVNSSQMELLSYLIHDLKTPLTSMSINLALLLKETEAENAFSLIKGTQAAVLRLERMLANLFDMVRQQEGVLSLNITTLYLEDLIEEAYAAIQIQAKARNISIEKSLGKWAKLVIHVDYEMMLRALVNLLENAIRSSPEKAIIRFNIIEKTNGLKLCIDDQGQGLKQDELPEIVKRFVQLNDPLSSQAPLSKGLGLSFVNMVATEHGMSLGLEESPDGGCRFFLEFLPVNSE
jgi:K+-sensing histidine kinase KdpD